MARRVILQMGHCFRRTGATGTNGIDGDPNEQEFAQAACYAAASHLRTAGHSPIVIDADEPDTSYQGDAFVAVHCDGSISADARGASVGYRTSEGAHLGAELKSAYAKAGWVGWRPDNYTAALAGYYGTGAAVRAGNRYAVIVESGFLTSPHDEPLLSLPDGPDRVARAITEAVVAVFGGAAPSQGDWLSMATEAEVRAIVHEEVVAAEARIIRQVIGNKPLIVAFDDVTPGDPDHWYSMPAQTRSEVTQAEAAQAVAQGNARWWNADVAEPLRVPRPTLEQVTLIED